MRHILSALSLLLVAIGANGITVQKIHLKNGSVLNGYISYQDKNEHLEVTTDSAVIYISDEYARPGRSVSKNLQELKNLGEAWAKWAVDHNALTGNAGDERMMMNDIEFVKRSHFFNDGMEVMDSTVSIEEVTPKFEDILVRDNATSKNPVKILEKGSVIKYLELTPNTYRLSWGDIDRIVSDKRPLTALSGVNRTYHKKNGVIVSGQFAGETYNTVSLYTPDGIIETIDLDEVDRLYIEPLNPAQSLYEQSELIDKVSTVNRPYEGIISQRDYSPNAMELIILSASGVPAKIKFKDIISYAKAINNDYKLLTDVLPKKNELLINRMHADSVNVVKNGNMFMLDSVPNKVIIPKANDARGTLVTVEFSNPQNKSGQNLIVVKLSKVQVKKKSLPGFANDVDVMAKYRPVNVTTSANKTTKMEYYIPETGIFAIYDTETKKAMPFIIK